MPPRPTHDRCGRQHPGSWLLMVGSMAFFAVEDLFLKRSAEALPPGQVLALTGAAGACVFWALAAGQRQSVLSMEALRGAALWRTLAEAAAAVLYILALALAPLTMTSALLQASPLVVVAGAALFLGETVGWRRWASILVGFAGRAGDPGALGRGFRPDRPC